MRAVTRAALSIGIAVAAFASTPAIAQTNPSAFTTGTRYDLMRRVVGTIAADPDGATGPLHYAAVRNTYDPAGRLTKVEKGELAAWQSETIVPSAWSTYTTFTIYQTVDTAYDGLDRKTRETVKGSNGAIFSVTDFSYDAVGRAECTAVRMNSAAWGTVTPACTAQSPSATDGADRITRNVYDDAGQLVQVREAVGVNTANGGADNLTGVAEATYSYTPNGKKEYVIDAEGNRAKLVYDGHDRLKCWVFPSKSKPQAYNDITPAQADQSAGQLGGDCAAATGDREHYTYDANGNRTSLRKRDNSTLTYQYDRLDRMTVKVVPERTGLPSDRTRDVYYGYDARNLMKYARFDSDTGPGITNAYDGFGRLQSATDNTMGTARTLSYLYDEDGNRIRITHPESGHYFVTIYDGLDRIEGAQWFSPTAGSTFLNLEYYASGNRADTQREVSHTSYGYNAAQQLNELNQVFAGNVGNARTTFTFNSAGQLSSETRYNDAFAYTGSRNTNRDYARNGLNQYTSVGPNPYLYDDNGNLTSDALNTFSYDVENRLVLKNTDVALYYDPMGRLTYYGGPAVSDTRFIYDGDQLALEYDSTGAVKNRYYFAGQDEPILVNSGPTMGCPTMRFLNTDRQGSIVAQADCSGNLTAINSYDEYGVSSVVTGRFGYTGQAWLPELGMYYYKARIYSPALGRFLQVDPIGYDDQVNLYAYVADDPVNHTDPSGKCFAACQAAVGRALDRMVDGVKADPVGSAVLAVSVVFDVVNTPLSPGPDASLGGAAFKLSRAEQIAVNAAKGAKGEAATAAKLGDKTAGKQVSFKTSDGTRTRADFVTKDRSVVESKTGDAGLTKGQQKLHDDINAGREVTPVGRNARDAGLEPGKPTKMNGCSIDRPC